MGRFSMHHNFTAVGERRHRTDTHIELSPLIGCHMKCHTSVGKFLHQPCFYHLAASASALLRRLEYQLDPAAPKFLHSV